MSHYPSSKQLYAFRRTHPTYGSTALQEPSKHELLVFRRDGLGVHFWNSSEEYHRRGSLARREASALRSRAYEATSEAGP